MSGRTITRFVLLGLFSVVAVIQIGGQNPNNAANAPQAPAAVNNAMPGKQLGTWYREVNGAVIEATFTDDELKVCTTHKFEGVSLNMTFLAHYSVTKDGLVHGAITGVDWNIKQTKEIDPKQEVPAQYFVKPAEYPLVRKVGTNTDKEVVVALFISSAPGTSPVFAGCESKIASEIAKKLPEMAKESKQKLRVLDPDLVNQFKKNNPNWKEMHPSEWGKKLGVDFVLDIQLEKMSLYQPGSLNTLYEGRADIIANIYDMSTVPNPVNSDEPRYNYVLPFKYPPTSEVLDASTIPLNKFKQDYLEHLAVEIARKHVAYKLDSTSDNKPPSSVPFGLDDATLTLYAQPLIDCPLSFRVNSTSAGLMVSSIKAPVDECLKNVFTLLAGMYKSRIDGDSTSQKSDKNGTEYGGMTLPSPRYLKHYPQYFPPDPTHPLPRELQDMEDPEGAARRAGIGGAPNALPSMPTSVPPSYPLIPKAVDDDEQQQIVIPIPTIGTSGPFPFGKLTAMNSAAKFSVAWSSHIISLPDPARNGKRISGLIGQLYLSGSEGRLDADGTLTIDLTDLTPRSEGKPGKIPECWVFDKMSMKGIKSALSADKGSDSYYVLFLPWPDYSLDVTQVRLFVRFEPEDKNQKVIKSSETILNLK